MQVYKRELKRLRLAKSLVRSHFPNFGINKKQEITRLLYEISKREQILPFRIIKNTILKDYGCLKRYLLQRRYPFVSREDRYLKPYLPKIELRSSHFFRIKEKEFCPKEIFIEQKAKSSFLAKRFRQFFPKAKIQEIESLKVYKCKHRGLSVEDYNKRQDAVFIINEGYDFFKRCPCTKGALSCGYHIFNLGFGCIFECTYCYLQGYVNSPGIILPENIDGFFDKFSLYKRKGMRIGTGEFSDSLALDNITQYSIPIIDFFRKQNDVTFEFKTKSVGIENIFKTKPKDNIVISWSLNPQAVIDKNEYLTPSLNERLLAALNCVKAGYRVGFHFDPVIYFHGWEEEYERLIEDLFCRIKPKHIAWISIGTFRFSPGLKQIIESRFPDNSILDEELLLGYDDKLRYPYAMRYKIYKKIIDTLSKCSPRLKIYLCMEESRIWKDLKLDYAKYIA